jgi:PAS domain-containing protein
METVFHQVSSSRDFMPHGHCYFWEPYILWSHAISDGIIALAYCAIPLTLIYIFRKRQDFKFIWIMVLFAVFIFGCGITHVFDVVTIWNPIYRLDSAARIITALASIATAVVLVKVTPNLLAIPTAAQWVRVNQELRAQVLALQEKDRTIEAFREFEALTETLPQLVWTNLADGTARFFNQRWYQYTGLPFEGSLERALEKAVMPRHLPAALKAWRQALAGQQPFEQELCLRDAGGITAGTWPGPFPCGRPRCRGCGCAPSPTSTTRSCNTRCWSRKTANWSASTPTSTTSSTRLPTT